MRRLRTDRRPARPGARPRLDPGHASGCRDELESNLLLLTCELVNNSVLHGEAGERDVIEVELRATETGLRAQVTDPGEGFAPGGRDREIDEPGGWGLVLVEQLSASWGVERDERTRVWFELAAA